MKTQIQVKNISGNVPTVTATAALDLLGLNWRADKKELFYRQVAPVGKGDGVAYLPALGYKAIIRSDNELMISVVTDRYNPIQNSTAFDIFTTVCQLAEGAHFISGGQKDGGKIVFVNGRLPHLEVKVEEDTIYADVSMHNSFDAKSSFKVIFVPWTMNEGRRVTFNQQVNIAVRHSGQAEQKIQEARQMLQTVNSYFSNFSSVVRSMSQVSIGDEDLDAFFGDIFGRSITEDDLAAERTRLARNLFQKQEGATLWHLYKAVMDFIDNFEGSQVEGAMFGYRSKLKEEITAQCMKVMSLKHLN